MSAAAARAERNAPLRKPANVSLDTGLVSEAKRLGINISRACEQGLAALIAEEKARHRRADNAEAIAASTAFVENNGLPVARLRQFLCLGTTCTTGVGEAASCWSATPPRSPASIHAPSF